MVTLPKTPTMCGPEQRNWVVADCYSTSAWFEVSRLFDEAMRQGVSKPEIVGRGTCH
jgi:hypothetical protein